ncbi:DUF1127 domain-containing protein [Zavarzinia sp. CC-PAN008]|uniref:DUF1127 domain-containing protein n=1 Tax=Zavarzinia sp. CC-PAN008 TaxID=3243332 RepID=UPI003F749AF1
MAMIGTRATAQGRRTSHGGILRRALDLVPALWAEWKARKAAWYLMGLDDARLRDIGLTRSEIDRVVRGGRPGPLWED